MSFYTDGEAWLTEQLTAEAATDSAVTYSDPDPALPSVVIQGVILPEGTTRRRDRNGALELIRIRKVLINEADLSRASLKSNGTIAVAGTTYAITHIGDVIGGMYDVSLESQHKYEITREGFRR